MSAPDRLKIGPHNYRIEYVEGLNDEGIKLWGLCIPQQHCIQIERNLPNHAGTAHTLLHEILHVIYSCLRIKKMTAEEDLVSGFADWLFMVLRDNEGLAEWLLRKE